MSYVKAEDVLPKVLLEEIQKYVDGQAVYIPRKTECALSWGEKSGTRERLAARNREIRSRYSQGETVAELSKVYYLSPKRIRTIIHECESSGRKEDGGIQNESGE